MVSGLSSPKIILEVVGFQPKSGDIIALESVCPAHY